MAAITRTSSFIARAEPTGRTSPSSSVRSSRTCSAGDISPISSRKIVPPRASSNRPFLSATAPVKDPRRWPKSSDSSSPSGSAPQLTGTKPRADRGP